MTHASEMPEAAPPAPLPRRFFGAVLRLRTYIALIAVVAFFAAMAPNFLSTATMLILLKHVAITAILAIGMSFVILTGGIDLSVGSIAGLSGMVAGSLLMNGLVLQPLNLVIYPDTWGVVLISLGIGAGIGLANGLLVSRFGVAPFIATLGMLYVARGAAMLSSGGTTFANLNGRPDYGNAGFAWLGSGEIAHVPVIILSLIILAVIAIVVASRTPFGRYVYAIGGNERASVLAGVKVTDIKIAVYVISGLCAALVGLLISSQLMAAHPASGETLELSAIAAVVLGGASLAGGRGTIGGALVGACVIGVLADGMVMMGVSEFWQMIIKGAVIVGAVILDQVQKNLAGGGRS